MKELWEIGFFHLLVNFENAWLSVACWGCILFGFAVQTLLFAKCKGPVKWVFGGVVLAAAVAGEVLSHIITGWDLLGLLLIYGAFVCCLVGVLAAVAVARIRQRKK